MKNRITWDDFYHDSSFQQDMENLAEITHFVIWPFAGSELEKYMLDDVNLPEKRAQYICMEFYTDTGWVKSSMKLNILFEDRVLGIPYRIEELLKEIL